MNVPVVYQCVKCGAPLEPNPERVYYQCSHCKTWQKFGADDNGRVVLLSLQASIARLLAMSTTNKVYEEESEWKDFLQRTQAELTKCEDEIPLAQTELESAKARQAEDVDRLLKYTLGFGVGLLVMFIYALGAETSGGVLLGLGIAIGCAGGLVHYGNQWLTLRRQPTPALRAARSKLEKLQQDCDEMRNDIAGTTAHLEMLNRQIRIEHRNKLRGGNDQPNMRT